MSKTRTAGDESDLLELACTEGGPEAVFDASSTRRAKNSARAICSPSASCRCATVWGFR